MTKLLFKDNQAYRRRRDSTLAPHCGGGRLQQLPQKKGFARVTLLNIVDSIHIQLVPCCCWLLTFGRLQYVHTQYTRRRVDCLMGSLAQISIYCKSRPQVARAAQTKRWAKLFAIVFFSHELMNREQIDALGPPASSLGHVGQPLDGARWSAG